MLKGANLVLYKAPALQLFYLLDFPGDSERLYHHAIFVWSGVIALCTKAERSVLVGTVEQGNEIQEVCWCNELKGTVVLVAGIIYLFYPFFFLFLQPPGK